MRKLRLQAAMMAMMAVVCMSIASPVAMASYHDSPYNDEYSPYHNADEGPPYYDDDEYPPYSDEYGVDWYVDEVTDEDCDEYTGTCEYEGVGEVAGYPAELEWWCDEEDSEYYGESCTLTDVDLL